MRRRDLMRFLPRAAVLTLLACGDDPVSAPTGTLEVTTATVGETGTATYTVRVDSGMPQPIGPNATLQISDLAAGEHEVLLARLIQPCRATDNPRTVAVSSGETARVEFRVVCTAQGSLVIAARTTGESRDPDGYLLRINGGPPRPMASDGSIRVEELVPGAYTVAIEDVAPNCSIGAGKTREVTVTDGTEQQVTFEVACTFMGAVRWDTVPLPAGFTSGFAAGKSLWGTSPSNLFVIGMYHNFSLTAAAILHYDGQEWTEQARFPDATLEVIDGVSATDVFVIGTRSGGSTIQGLILHYDGSRWSEMAGPVADPTRAFYTDIWRAVSGEILLVGSIDGTGMLARYDGVTWSQVEVPGLGMNGAVTHASGTSSTDVWAVDWDWNCDECTGITSAIGHWDGVQSSIVHSRRYPWYREILALAPNDVWVVGGDDGSNGFARVLRWDGTTWTEEPPIPEDEYLQSLGGIWASSSADVYAAGGDVLLRFDGSSWSKIPGLGGHTVWGLSRDHVYLLDRDYEVDRDFLIHGSP